MNEKANYGPWTLSQSDLFSINYLTIKTIFLCLFTLLVLS